MSNGMNLQLSQFGIFRGGGVAFWGDLTTSNLITQLFLVEFDLLSRVMVNNAIKQDLHTKLYPELCLCVI